MNLIKGGGKGGLSKEIIVGNNINRTPILPIEMFQEIKKSLNMSKTKMEEMCHIMRKFQVKMTPNVREKLWAIDHLLDDHYVTLRVKATKTVTVEIEDDFVDRRGRKRSKPGPRTERREVEVEKDITFLKNPKSFIDNLIIERNLFSPDVIKRVSTDGGDNSIKIIVNVFDKHQDPEIFFPQLEKKGNICSGVNRSIILVYCEDLEENYNNLYFVTVAECKWPNVLLRVCHIRV